MSRSWTDRWRQMRVRDEAAVMLAVTPDRVDAVWLDAAGAAQDYWVVDVAMLSDTAQIDEHTRRRLAQSLQPLAERLSGTYSRILVSVPDAAATANVFAFDRLPWRRAAQEKLLRWRLNKQRGADLGDASLQWQAFRNGDGVIQVWTTVLADSWRDAVLGALADVGIVPAVLDIEARYLFNWLHRRGHVGGRPGALLNVAESYFGLMMWDAAGRPAWFRSRWRQHIARERSLSDTERMVSELQRMVFAYAGTPQAVPFRNLCLAHAGQEPGLADALSRQLGVEVILLQNLVRTADTRIVGERRARTLTMGMGQ